MAEDAVDHAAVLADLELRECVTRELNIHGHHAHADRFGSLALYGADAPALQALLDDDPDLGAMLHPRLPVRVGELVWGARHEMARTVDDVLARRTRCLILDARAASEAAPAAARVLARELGRGPAWFDQQVADFTKLAQAYLPQG
jgi:glycerol-3-phosphate dehydrogenase